jgi:histone H3/H4
MTECKDIKFCSRELLKIVKSEKDVKIIEEQKILKLLNEYIERLIFNITALASLLCLKMGIKKIMNEHVKFLLQYINKYCKTKDKKVSMKGGAFNTAQFFGIDETNRYSVKNEGVDLLRVDFNNNIARPEIGFVGVGGGGKVFCSKLNRILKIKVKHVFKYFNVKIENRSLEFIMLKFNDILRNVTIDIKSIRGNVIKYNDVKKILYKGNIMKK